MSTSSDPHDEQAGGHFAWKRSENRITRLQIEGKMLISALGGVWPEQPADAEYRRVLDVSCGVGCWLMQAARMYPQIENLYGVDANPHLIARARQCVEEQHLADRLEFRVMDALSMLEFPFQYLDLVSIQMGGSVLRTWEWGKLLQEFQRVTRPGGVIRVVEQDWCGESSSPALKRLIQMLIETLYRAGHLFVPKHNGLLCEMPRLFKQFGILDVQTCSYPLEVSATTPGWSDYMAHIPSAITPFLTKWGRLPEDYDELCEQALYEMAQPDFVARWRMEVVWGRR